MNISRNNLVYSLGRLRHLALRFIEREMERRGIEGMALLRRRVHDRGGAGPLSMKEIARLTYKDKSTITGDRTGAGKGPVSLALGRPSDGRAALVSITPEAVKIIPALGAVSALMNERLFDGFSERDCRTLFRLLGKLGANLKSAAPSTTGTGVRAERPEKGGRA